MQCKKLIGFRSINCYISNIGVRRSPSTKGLTWWWIPSPRWRVKRERGGRSENNEISN